jgi:predicted pyridoxine 5'-phosphate oxidase superfamily flavin-nucleotide-binding protein
MVNISEKGMKAFQEDAAPKYLATINDDGIPNVVPILSLDTVDEQTIMFGDYMIWKTKDNLLSNSRVACAATSMKEFKTYILKGNFKEFIKKGDLVDRANQKELFKYNAYTGVRGIGIISVENILPSKKLLSLSMLTNIIKMKLGKGAVETYQLDTKNQDHNGVFIHPRIMNHFKGITSLKCLAFKDEDEYPMIIPLTSMSPKKDRHRLVFSYSGIKKEIERIPLLSKVAISIFKLKTDKNILSLAFSDQIPLGLVQPIAYQIKGRYKGIDKFRGVSLGVIDVEEVYSSSPPLPGERIA